MAYADYKNPDLYAMTGRHLLPLWDEKLLLAFAARQDKFGRTSFNEFQAREPYLFRQKRLGNVSVDDSMLLLKECLKDNQGYFLIESNQPFRVKFPYAMYMKKGDLITNLTTGEIYTIANVYDDESHDVLLSGKRRPRATDRLRLAPENEVVFTHGFPRAFSAGHKFSEVGSVADKPAPWNEAITYVVSRSMPGSLDSSPPFGGTKNMKPKFRESVEDPLDPVLCVETEGWLFDNLVQFDCWSKTNAEAVKLLKWFEDFMIRHTWIFELYGVSKVLYWERDEDAEVPVWRNDLTKRSVTFYFRTERLFFSRTRKLSHVTIDVSVDINGKPMPDKYSDIVPDASSSDVWPDPTSSIDVNFIQASI